MTYEPGEGPIDDVQAAKKRAEAEHGRPEHAYRVEASDRLYDPRDRADYDLEDPGKQRKDDE